MVYSGNNYIPYSKGLDPLLCEIPCTQFLLRFGIVSLTGLQTRPPWDPWKILWNARNTQELKCFLKIECVVLFHMSVLSYGKKNLRVLSYSGG